MQLHLSDLGGESNCSEAEKSLIRRASVLSVELERMEAAFAVDKTDAAALDAYQRASNSLRRLLESLGLKRRARPVQNLVQYIEATYGGDDKGKAKAKAKAKAQDLEVVDA